MSFTPVPAPIEVSSAAPADEGLLRRLGGSLAHHVNNALTGVIGYLELALRHTPADAPAHDHLRASLACAHRAAETVRRVVGFACRTEAPGRLAPLSLARLAGEVAARAGTSAVSVTVADGPEGTVRANHALLWLAVDAVLQNAIESSPVDGTVSLWVEQQDDHCCLHVRDRGAGLSPEAQARLFEPFWTTKMGAHLGLGLVMAREVVLAQGGALTIRPADEGGTLATFTFPSLGPSAPRTNEQAHPLAAPHLTVSAHTPVYSI
jgi:signal transduction histidine kinase